MSFTDSENAVYARTVFPLVCKKWSNAMGHISEFAGVKANIYNHVDKFDALRKRAREQGYRVAPHGMLVNMNSDYIVIFHEGMRFIKNICERAVVIRDDGEREIAVIYEGLARVHAAKKAQFKAQKHSTHKRQRTNRHVGAMKYQNVYKHNHR
jgi:hypothetical protein